MSLIFLYVVALFPPFGFFEVFLYREPSESFECVAG